MAGAGSFLQEYQKNYSFRVSDYVSQLLSFSPKKIGKKGLIVATLVIVRLNFERITITSSKTVDLEARFEGSRVLSFKLYALEQRPRTLLLQEHYLTNNYMQVRTRKQKDNIESQRSNR